MMKRLVLIIASLAILCGLQAQSNRGYDVNYHLLHSGKIIMDKGFYLATAILQSPAVLASLLADDNLTEVLRKQVALTKTRVTDTCERVESLLDGFRWATADSLLVDAAIRHLYDLRQAAFDDLVDNQLRPSGYYQRFIGYGNQDLLLHAWGQYVVGINYIIDQFGLGKKMRYPLIDSASFDVRGRYYQNLLKVLFAYLSEKTDSMQFFFQPSLALALELMRANDRDEPARFEPLEAGENRAAVERAKTIKWEQYPYSTILVPGEGPEVYTIPLDALARLRCDLAADRWRRRLAPFIIASGGYCHPSQTSYCEALEMKKYLIGKCGLPESAVIIDPQARHTTTNFRNAGRLMIRYGMPIDKPSLCVTTKDQADYIDDPRFARRCLKELGYVPYRNPIRLSFHEFRFFTLMDCLHMDPYDPLDP
jgi:hypothetical protein